jgi:hypothetical protein
LPGLRCVRDCGGAPCGAEAGRQACVPHERDVARRFAARIAAAADERNHADREHADGGRAECDQAPPHARIEFERCDEVRHRREACARIDGQPAKYSHPELARDAVAARLGRARVDRLAELGSRGARERARAVQRLVQRDAERELIAALVGALAVELLGRHVRHGAHRLGGRFGGRVREPEIADPDATIVTDEDVVGFDVAMDHAGCMRARDAASGLGERTGDLARRSRRA